MAIYLCCNKPLLILLLCLSDTVSVSGVQIASMLQPLKVHRSFRSTMLRVQSEKKALESLRRPSKTILMTSNTDG